jgi:IclR family transcriptional regulator, acetate operon repressor
MSLRKFYILKMSSLNSEAPVTDDTETRVRSLEGDTLPQPSPSEYRRPPQSSERGASGGVQSVERALNLLELLAQSGNACALTDLAARAKLNISTCHHLLATLIKTGYVAQVPGRRTYALGARVLHLGQAFMQQVDLPRRAQPVLDRLNAATGEAVHLAVLQGDQVVTIAKNEARHAVRVDTGAIGSAEAPHATATGKAMLAWLPEDQARRILRVNGLTRFTPHTVTDSEVLLEEMRHVRRNGFAMDREEFQPGVVCVGAAVRDQAGAVIGSLSASAPLFRADEIHLERMRAAVIAAARELSAELGAPAVPPAGGDLPVSRNPSP